MDSHKNGKRMVIPVFQNLNVAVLIYGLLYFNMNLVQTMRNIPRISETNLVLYHTMKTVLIKRFKLFNYPYLRILVNSRNFTIK